MTSLLLIQIKNNNIINNINPKYSNETGKEIIINKTLHTYLNKIKTQIDLCQMEWDKYKKYTNMYEYIDSIIPNTKQSISTLKPLSRSFYKMIEICKMMYLLNDLPSTMCKTFHLAEGPGGFIEALVKMRNNPQDIYYGMTLVDNYDYNVPGWKKSNHFLIDNPNVLVDYGKDGKGDLMNPENLRYCYERFHGTMDLITGDGGFDFSVDFNNQENTSLKLMFCQIAYAISMQKVKGNFLIKFFDTFTKMSLDLLYLLSCIYENVYFVKPYTSRSANSEKYVVCKGFRLENVEDLVKKLYKIISEFVPGSNIISLFDFDLPYIFTNKIEEYNSIFGQQQIENISATINLIENNTHTNKYDKLETMKKNNIQKCISWCQKYNIPYNKNIHNSNIFLSAR
jgi:23S rRNA U2552 (ribose-2'-O)-methylase RlmE/FtsJ